MSFNVVHEMCQKTYDQVYITFSGIKGHNYGNVMELVSKVNLKAFFITVMETKL